MHNFKHDKIYVLYPIYLYYPKVIAEFDHMRFLLFSSLLHPLDSPISYYMVSYFSRRECEDYIHVTLKRNE